MLRTYLDNLPGEGTLSKATMPLATQNQPDQGVSVNRSLVYYSRTKSSPSLLLRGGDVTKGTGARVGVAVIGGTGGTGSDTADFRSFGPNQRTELGTKTSVTVDNRSGTRKHHHYTQGAGLVHAASSRDVRFSEQHASLGGSREKFERDRRGAFSGSVMRIEEGSGLGLEYGGYQRDWAASSRGVSNMRAGIGDSRRGRSEDRAEIVPADHRHEMGGPGIDEAGTVERQKRGNRRDEATGDMVGRGAEKRQNKAEDHERLGNLYSMIARR